MQASRNAAGNVTGFSGICNSILSDPVVTGKGGVNVDLAVKTVLQTAVLGRNATQFFNVDVFNLGTATIPASNITLELRFDGSAWQVLPYNMACTSILAHSGVVDRIVVGERCTLPGPVAGGGGVVPVSFLLEPLGPDATRPATTIPQPVLSVKASIIDEQLEGADVNAANNTAAFPGDLAVTAAGRRPTASIEAGWVEGWAGAHRLPKRVTGLSCAPLSGWREPSMGKWERQCRESVNI